MARDVFSHNTEPLSKSVITVDNSVEKNEAERGVVCFYLFSMGSGLFSVEVLHVWDTWLCVRVS